MMQSSVQQDRDAIWKGLAPSSAVIATFVNYSRYCTFNFYSTASKNKAHIRVGIISMYRPGSKCVLGSDHIIAIVVYCNHASCCLVARAVVEIAEKFRETAKGS